MKINELIKHCVVLILALFNINNPLNAQDFFESIEKKLIKYKEAAPKERVLIITDREIYAPGELLWFNATTYNISSSNVSELSKELSIYLVNANSQDILAKKFMLKEGNANGFIEIPNINQEGVYYLQGETKNSDKLYYCYKKIIVKKKILPQFIIKASFKEKVYFPGDHIDMTIEFQDYYNEQKRSVEYKVDFYNGGKRISGLVGKTKKADVALVNAKVPLKLESGLFSYTIDAESKDAKATLSGNFPMLTDQIFIDFYPENGKIIDAIETKVSFFAYDATGSPLSIHGDLIESGNQLLAINTDIDGLGHFNFSPDIEKTYHVQIKRPLLLDREYSLPEIAPKGIALNEMAKDGNQVSYKLINGYQSTRTVFLIGVSDGVIFWKSEHEIDRELQVEIDLSKASGRLAHLIALNAAEKIEGEHILVVPREFPSEFNVDSKELSSGIRGRNEMKIDLVPSGGGKVIFTAVNSPWLNDNLNKQNTNSISLPFDIGAQLVFQSSAFCESDLNDQDIERYKNFYVPFGFGWGRILNTKEALHFIAKNDLVSMNQTRLEQLCSNYKIEVSDSKITHTNITAEQVFVMSNPKYTASLYIKKQSRIPSYKRLLENGTSVLDVLKTIKPYNLQGNNIVFLGSANSLNFQGGALIVIDGVNRGTDASILATISPYEVETISASTDPNDIQRYTGLNSVGVIEITLKRGPGIIEQKEYIDEGTQFSAPSYKNEHSGILDDFRSTLWWDVINLDTTQEKTSIVYYNSELISDVKGRVYFIPKMGVPSMKSFDYQIR